MKYRIFKRNNKYVVHERMWFGWSLWRRELANEPLLFSNIETAEMAIQYDAKKRKNQERITEESKSETLVKEIEL